MTWLKYWGQKIFYSLHLWNTSIELFSLSEHVHVFFLSRNYCLTHVWTESPQPNRKLVMEYVFGTFLLYIVILGHLFGHWIFCCLFFFVRSTTCDRENHIIYIQPHHQHIDTLIQSHAYHIYDLLLYHWTLWWTQNPHICGDSAFFTLVRYFSHINRSYNVHLWFLCLSIIHSFDCHQISDTILFFLIRLLYVTRMELAIYLSNTIMYRFAHFNIWIQISFDSDIGHCGHVDSWYSHLIFKSWIDLALLCL